MHPEIGKDIKSVNIRSTRLKRQLLMPPSKVDHFQNFLKENLKSEILVVNTNVGMEIYYYSQKDCSQFIKESLLIHTITTLDSTKLKFRINSSEQEVFQCFEEALTSFAKYPRLFLAYIKKFLYLQRANSESIYLVPILRGYFEEVYERLKHNHNLPYFDSIEKARSAQKTYDEDDLIKKLVSEILMKRHHN